MLTFMKNVKKVLGKDGAQSAIHYQKGRAYASNRYSCIWVEDPSGREGAVDVTSNLAIEDAQIPDYSKILPELRGNEPYATADADELKAAIACAPNPRIMECILLVWRVDGLTAYVRDDRLRVEYRFSGAIELLGLKGGQSFFAAFDARQLCDLVDYLRQRKAQVRIYASASRRSPLRMEVNLDTAAVPAGGLIAPLTRFEEERFADVIPSKAE